MSFLVSRRVLIAGVSTRAAAESAAQAGFEVTAIDAFGDLDQHASVRSVSLARTFTADAAARVAGSVECDAVAYLASFENHPSAVIALAAGRTLWGNAPDVLGRVRNPPLVGDALRRRGLPVTEVNNSSECPPEGGRHVGSKTDWLVKPLASGGGHGVRPWRRGTRGPRGGYLQEVVSGTPGSVVFVAAAGRAVPLGVSRQLVGEHAFGASGYQYCGNILAAAGDAQFARDATLVDSASALAHAVADEFGVVGVNGIDFIACDGIPFPIEVNPRWCSSMELVERAYGLSVFGAHAAACEADALPAFDLMSARRGAGAAGKAILFAPQDITIGDTRAWLADSSVRDIPRPGSRIVAGRPICTVFAADRDAVACYAALVRRAERVYVELAAWDRAARGASPA
jgi:predicted ATP-grasp superfamily ATP-dependent carboligase